MIVTAVKVWCCVSLTYYVYGGGARSPRTQKKKLKQTPLGELSVGCCEGGAVAKTLGASNQWARRIKTILGARATWAVVPVYEFVFLC